MKPVRQAPEPADRLSTLSVRDLIAELVQVEDTLHRLPTLLAEAESVVPPAARPLLQREHAIMDELTARRHKRGLIAAPLVPQRDHRRTPPPWA